MVQSKSSNVLEGSGRGAGVKKISPINRQTRERVGVSTKTQTCFDGFLWSVVRWPSGLLKFWYCQNVGSNPGLAGRGACVLEQDTLP